MHSCHSICGGNVFLKLSLRELRNTLAEAKVKVKTMTPYQTYEAWQIRCDAQNAALLEESLDTQPEPKPIPPCCGQCIHFRESRILTTSNGRQMQIPSYCIPRADLERLNPFVSATSQPCRCFKEDAPF
jgi:hypothetical protein